MTDLYNKLSLQKEKISSLEKELILAKHEYLTIQIQAGIQYKKDLARKYLSLWDKSNKFPIDDELTQVIFYLAGDKTEKTPKTELKFDGVNFKFYYFNVRLQAYICIA
jgi:hypothetical protein